MANTSLKSMGTRDELSITLYLQSEINFCSEPSSFSQAPSACGVQCTEHLVRNSDC